MVKPSLFIICILAMTIFVASSASASMIISQPNALYSLGDDLSFEVKIDAVITGYLDINLVCAGSVENIFHDVPGSTTMGITRTLIPAYIKNSEGTCYLAANYDEQSVTGQNFQISSSINVDVSTNDLSYVAGNSVRVKGTAYKSNNELVGQKYKAFVEVIMNEEIKAKAEVKDSQFDVSFKIPETTQKGNYLLNVRVTEEDSEGNVLNNGEANSEVKITQQPTKIEIAMDKQSINPGENLSLFISVYDAAGDLVEGKTALKIEDSIGTSLYERNIDLNQNIIITTKTTNPAGVSRITARKDNLAGERFFQINEQQKIESKIVNGSLELTNIGNIPYYGIVEIKIGEQVIAKEVSLQLEESKIYAISAPDGNYDIIVTDKTSSSTLSGIALTGDAVSVDDAKTMMSNIFANYPIVWAFLIIIIALAVWVYYRKHGERKRLGFAPFGSSGTRITHLEKKRGGVEVIKPEAVTSKINELAIDGDIRNAEQVAVLHGQKQPVSIIAIKIKNNLQGIAKQNFGLALEKAYKHKAVSYNSGEFVLLIFSPLVTKTMKNEETSIKTAIDIDNFFREHNRKFRNDIIRYGIGVNDGDLINKMTGKVLQFTNISNTIVLAKKIADSASDGVLLSKQIHEKTMNNIKAEKAMAGNLEAFAIKRVVDKEKSEKFIQGFLRRNTVQ